MGALLVLESARSSLTIALGVIIAVIAALGSSERLLSRFDETSGRPDWKIVRLPSSSSSNPIDTVIENKNVNIIVNVDPKDVAKELWKLLQTRLDERDTRRSTPTENTLGELERIVTPIVKPTRRSRPPRMYDVSLALDRVIRSAMLDEYSGEPTIDDEIEIHETVARMMFKLKTILESEERGEIGGTRNHRRSFVVDTGEAQTKRKVRTEIADVKYDDESYVTVMLKLDRTTLCSKNA